MSTGRGFSIVPRGLAGQLILGTIAVLLIAQAIVISIALYQQAERFERDSGDFLARRVALVAGLLNTTPSSLHSKLLKVASAPGLRFRVDPQPPGLPPAPMFEAWLVPHLRAQGLTGSIVVRLPASSEDPRDRRPGGLVAVPVNIDGANAWLTLTARHLGSPSWPWYALGSLLLAALGSALVIALLVRRVSRPLATLSAAAERLGRGEAIPSLEERGPSDIRATIVAFNQMQSRLQRFVQDRTRLLAAISHDLRSPITALRLRAEMVDQDELRERMVASLDEMQTMVEATLAFARDDSAREKTETVDLSQLVDDAIEARTELGYPIKWNRAPPLLYPCRPLALKRALGNLIDNALRYGKDVEVLLEGTNAVVRDRGPGIPNDQLEFVFEPFARLEESRSSETGGTGLGLAIARSIARNHGGDIVLSNRPEGGLEARLALPAAD
jgi:signal transduction histidine kinase